MEKIILYYQSILGVDLENLNHPISKLVSLAKSKIGIEEKQIKQKLRLLGLALMNIKDYDHKIYDFYIKKTINNADFSYNGYIFEIIQCAYLISKSIEEKLKFEFGNHMKDEPDFIIDNCGLELTSIRFSEESRKENADSKLLKKFREKNEKKYANENCILLIEATQPIHFANQSDHRPNIAFKKVLETISHESKFGLVLCYVEYTVQVDDNIHFKGTSYTAYGKNCSENVKALFMKITNGEFNMFDGTQSISKY